jgi:ribosomal protein S18 acetylase RimI-like enzyme
MTMEISSVDVRRMGRRASVVMRMRFGMHATNIDRMGGDPLSARAAKDGGNNGGTQVSLEWIRTHDAVNWEELSALYRAAPLGDKKPDHLRKVFSNSLYVSFAYDGEKLVGAGRALADGGDCSYICDIAVLPSHQGTGLGKQLVGDLVERSRGHKKIILYAVPGREPFYRKFGFLRMKTAMAIFENQKQELERGYLSED